MVSLIYALINKANFDGLCEHGHLALHVMRSPCSKYFPHITLVLHAAEATLSSMPSTSTPASPPLHPPDDMSYNTFDINVELELVTHTFLSTDPEDLPPASVQAPPTQLPQLGVELPDFYSR